MIEGWGGHGRSRQRDIRASIVTIIAGEGRRPSDQAFRAPFSLSWTRPGKPLSRSGGQVEWVEVGASYPGRDGGWQWRSRRRTISPVDRDLPECGGCKVITEESTRGLAYALQLASPRAVSPQAQGRIGAVSGVLAKALGRGNGV